MILMQIVGPKHKMCRIFCKKITRNLIPGYLQLSRIFSIFAIFCLYVTEFAGNWVDFDVLQKVLQKFRFSQKVQKNFTELSKR